MDSESDLSTIIDGAGPIAGLFVLLVAIALVLLWLNMNRQMKRIDPDLPRGRSEVPRSQESGDMTHMEESAEQDPDASRQ
jgi:hypothetical protein